VTTLLADLDPADRPRERLLRLGPDALSDAELVALLLGSGRRGRGAVDLARDLLDAHGGLPGMSHALPDDLRDTPGVGAAKATRVVAALALARRFGTSTDRRETVRTPADVARIAGPLLGPDDHRIAVVIGDRACRLVDALVLPVGAHDRPPPVRPGLAEVLRRGGVTVALAHRHPVAAGTGAGPGGEGDPAGASVVAHGTTRALHGPEDVTAEARDPGVVPRPGRGPDEPTGVGDPVSVHPADHALGRALDAAGALCGVRLLEHLVLHGDGWVRVTDPPARTAVGRRRTSGASSVPGASKVSERGGRMIA
jgi:DNA repair protein RadC